MILLLLLLLLFHDNDDKDDDDYDRKISEVSSFFITSTGQSASIRTAYEHAHSEDLEKDNE
jgi:hypothetical protein